MVVITKDGIESYHPFAKQPSRFCIFEYVYFSRPDSVVEGRNVYEVRKRIGAELAREAPADADMVDPGAGFRRARGARLCQRVGLPFELGIIRNHYVGRTFIEPTRRHPQFRRAQEAQSQPRHARRQARRAGRRFHRARHDLQEDRADGARRRRDGSAFPRRQPADDAFLLLRRRHAEHRRAARAPHGRRGDAPLHRRRQPRLHLDGRPLSRDGRGRSATPRRRNSATPASPATIRST